MEVQQTAYNFCHTCRLANVASSCHVTENNIIKNYFSQFKTILHRVLQTFLVPL